MPCAQVLVESGKLNDMDVPDAHGLYPLQLAVAHGHTNTAIYLVLAKADLTRSKHMMILT